MADRLVGVISEARPPVDAPVSLAAAAGFVLSADHDHDSDAVLTRAEEALDRTLKLAPTVHLRPER